MSQSVELSQIYSPVILLDSSELGWWCPALTLNKATNFLSIINTLCSPSCALIADCVGPDGKPKQVKTAPSKYLHVLC